MKGIMIAGLALILVVAVPFTVLGESKGKGTRSSGSVSGYEVQNPNHTQALGCTSTHAYNGLSVAAERSRKVHPVAPSPSEGGIKGGSFGTVTSSGPAKL